MHLHYIRQLPGVQNWQESEILQEQLKKESVRI